MTGGLWGDPGVVGFPRGIDDGELDDLVQKAAPLPGRQPVGVGDGSQLPGPVGQRWQMLDPGDDVVVQLGVEPGQLGQFDQRVDGSGGFPVDEGHRQAVPGDDVPRRDVAVADDFVRAAQIPTVPGEPHRVHGRAECPCRFVQGAQQSAERGGAVQTPRPGRGELAVDKRQRLAAIEVQARADQTRRRREANVREVAKQGMHRWGPWRGSTDYRFATPVDDVPAAAFEDHVIGRGHSSL